MADKENGVNGIPVIARLPDELPVLVVKGGVVFPGLVAPLIVTTERSARLVDDALAGDRLVCAVSQRDNDKEEAEPEDLYEIGTVSVILKMLRFPDGTIRLLLQGLRKARVSEYLQTTPYLKARVGTLDEPEGKPDVATEALMRNVVGMFRKLAEMAPYLSDEVVTVVMNTDSPGRLADTVASYLQLDVSRKQELLEILDPRERLTRLGQVLTREIEIFELGAKIRDRVKGELDKSQREYFLREQLKAIKEELGEQDERQVELDELEKRVEESGMSEAAAEAAKRELDRLGRMPPASMEYTVSRNYLDWLLALPWKRVTEDRLDIRRARRVLNEDHYDLKQVKERIIEFLAVRRLKSDSRGPILCFVGPPGVGKTSLGKSIARAMGREFYRFSLGGMRDEAEIRGHRRTYVGALPGRIVQGLRNAGSMNPVFMLDEIDKLGADFRGDPSSALLEVLDPEQNSSFSDHYLEVPLDLSRVLFITTANVTDTIIPALRDRMEVLELPGYTEEDKLEIARSYLVPRQLRENGLVVGKVGFGDDAIRRIIRGHTREAGVRNLEREIGSICRKVARGFAEGRGRKRRIAARDVGRLLGEDRFTSEVAARAGVPGVSTGLAVTAFGGEILFVESSLMKGRGGLTLTGSLGEVMRESAQAALSYVRAHARELVVDPEFFEGNEVHVHVPAGATPKDGPSAGVAIVASLLSLLRGRALDPRVAMTGEITLTGRVLGVGGIKEKVLAANRAGIRTIILPAENRKDLKEVPPRVRKGLRFSYVRSLREVARLLFP
ncbi:endopeptidase La [candidate division WOR-3 bacterium]|nr:endopeptidase La [candidate division WOR-3 bacterium]